MRYERSVQALTDLFAYYGTSESAEAALDALARIAHPSSVAAVCRRSLSGKNSTLRLLAIEGLARIGDATRLPAIQAAVDADKNEAVALAGLYASARLANERIDRIADALTKSRLRVQARQYLLELLPGRAGVGHLASFRIPTRGCVRTSSNCSASAAMPRRCRSSSRC